MENELFLSPISTWEALVLARRGRLELRPSAGAWIRAALAASPTTMVPVTHDIAARSEELRGYRQTDPGDRFLVATALVHDLAILTADRAMHRYRALTTVW